VFSVPRGRNGGKPIAEKVNSILNEGTPVWVAQSKGRSRSGDFRTNQTLINTYAVANRMSIDEYCATTAIVPVAVSAEYDPTAGIVAQLAAGRKLPLWSDAESVLKGMLLWKGSVHVGFARPIGRYERALDCNAAIDRAIHKVFRCYDTHRQSFAERSRFPEDEWRTAPVNLEMIDDRRLRRQIADAPQELQPRIVARYAYPVRNQLGAQA
jgi:hypothetical protein